MNASKTSPHLPQIQSFVNALMSRQYDQALRLVFADFLEEECGWSEEGVVPLRDGSLTGRYPYCRPYRGIKHPYGWLPQGDREPWYDSCALPPAVFYRLPRAGFEPGHKFWGTSSLTRAWEALRTAQVRWASRRP